MTLALDCEPPDTGAFGRRESPSMAVTRAGARPSPSAATWVMIVYMPVPMSCVPLATVALPSARTRTVALAGERLAG